MAAHSAAIALCSPALNALRVSGSSMVKIANAPSRRMERGLVTGIIPYGLQAWTNSSASHRVGTLSKRRHLTHAK
jgi:hypothetical protein